MFCLLHLVGLAAWLFEQWWEAFPVPVPYFLSLFLFLLVFSFSCSYSCYFAVAFPFHFPVLVLFLFLFLFLLLLLFLLFFLALLLLVHFSTAAAHTISWRQEVQERSECSSGLYILTMLLLYEHPFRKATGLKEIIILTKNLISGKSVVHWRHFKIGYEDAIIDYRLRFFTSKKWYCSREGSIKMNFFEQWVFWSLTKS